MKLEYILAGASLPVGPGQCFRALAQGKVDFTVAVEKINEFMTIMATEEAIYIDREQALAFFAESSKPTYEELVRALGDLSFECFAGMGVRPPSIDTYNRTFDVLQRARGVTK